MSIKTMKEERCDEVMNLLLSGHKPFKIVKMIKPRWGCSEKTVYNYINLARKQMKHEIEAVDTDTIFSRYEYIYLEHIRQKNYVRAKEVLDSIMRFRVGDKISTTSLVDAITINIKRNRDSDVESDSDSE